MPNALTSGDLRKHAALGISASLLEAAGVRRVTDAEARERLGTTKQRGDCGGILYPRLDPLTGHEVGYRVRRDAPEIEDGKPVNKYLSSIDRLHLYFAPDVRALAKNPAVPAIFVESEKATLALTALAARAERTWLVIGTGGCWGWRGRIGKTEAPNGARVDELGPAPDFARLAWTDRLVYIIFDGDVAARPDLRVARSKLAGLLKGKGARVRLIDLPLSPGVTGPDDYVEAAGDEGLIALLDAPQPINGHTPRSVHLVPASTIPVRPVRWLWQDRIALGTLALLGGREGIGKSILAYTLAADITRGRMTGIHCGMPKAVIVAATEDSWSHTIVPRLMAADADLTRVFRVDVQTVDGALDTLSLPMDLHALEAVIREADAALILLDPLLSRLESTLDTHKDANVRVALEPLVALGDATGACILGLIHLNKSASTDMLTLLMGSRAFAAVARSVLFAMEDPDTEGQRLLGQAKNNLGKSDLPTLTFTVTGACVAVTDEGEVWTGKLTWTGESDRSIKDALQASTQAAAGDQTAVTEAAEWLADYLQRDEGESESGPLKKFAHQAGHAERTLQRARVKLRVQTTSRGYPRRTYWRLPLASVRGQLATPDTVEFQ